MLLVKFRIEAPYVGDYHNLLVNLAIQVSIVWATDLDSTRTRTIDKQLAAFVLTVSCLGWVPLGRYRKLLCKVGVE